MKKTFFTSLFPKISIFLIFFGVTNVFANTNTTIHLSGKNAFVNFSLPEDFLAAKHAEKPSFNEKTGVFKGMFYIE